jgi:hypothetical protein
MATNQTTYNRDLKMLADKFGFDILHRPTKTYKWILKGVLQHTGELGFKTKQSLGHYLVMRSMDHITHAQMMGHLQENKNFNF